MTEGEALQASLAAQHAACYGYGVIGGLLAGLDGGGPDDLRANDAYTAHRTLRDQLVELISTLGEDPVAALAAYATPFPVRSIAACRRFARVLEDRCAAVHAYTVAETAGDTRQLLAGALTGCALRGFEWGAKPTALPGIDPS